MTVPVSVGVCAYNEEKRIAGLLDSVISQALPPPNRLDEILVVASGCTDRTEEVVEAARSKDARIRLIREADRKGKVSALNRLLDEYRGDILVLVNADARLRPGSLEALVRPFREDPMMQVACGSPMPEDGHSGLQSLIEGIQWRVHNRSLAALSDLRTDNHCCDEFMAMRRGFLATLPPDLINDGAYIGVIASLRGLSVRFCPEAEVLIETPQTVRGIVQQRVRILRGHRQIRRMLGRSPNTIEGMATRRPDLAVKMFRDAFHDRASSLLPFLAVALPVELYAAALALWQDFATGDHGPAWTPVE